ncbi:MAG: glucose dehydrogenase [Paenibacillaceae bacterium]|nr:glucose dehydrogenase [Paenibacillaceae bacterium]
MGVDTKMKMKAIRVQNIMSDPKIAVVEVDRPSIASSGQAMVRVLCVGLDGTDKDILKEHYGEPPQGESELTTGHESLGVVEEAGDQSGLAPGDLVTALVRRPCRDPECVNCRNERADFCQTGKYVERGIKGAHGYLAQYYVEESRYLVKVPADLLKVGMLAEPQSIVEKVWDQIQRIQQRMIWEPRNALVLGAGPLGLLAAATCRSLGLNVHVWSNGDDNSPSAELVKQAGGIYQQADSKAPGAPASVSEYAKSLACRFDLIWECTGYSPLAFEAMGVLGPNGVLALLGVSPGDKQMQVGADRLNEQIVLENKCILGSVNASRKDFETGLYRLQQIERQFPGWLSRLITKRITLDEVPGIDFHQIGIKAVVDVAPPNDWEGLAHTKKEVEYSFSV